MIESARIPLSRLWQIRRAIKRNGLHQLLSQLKLSRKAKFALWLIFGGKRHFKEARGVRIRQTLEELGPVFVKLGQALSTRPDLLPADVAMELTKLQDQVPPFSGKQALATIKASFGDEFNTIFESVDAEPLASASIAQVHTARLAQGKAIAGKNGLNNHEVIIKVLRPNITKVIDSDLQVMYKFANLLQTHWEEGSRMKPVEVIKEYDITIHDELDLRHEAANCCQMADNFKHSDIIYVPQVYWDYTHQNVMVMERIYGTSIREIDTLKTKGFDLSRLAEDGVAVFFKQAFEDNFFHADMHPGNIFVSDEGRWIAVDFGIMGTLTDEDKRYLADNLLGFFHRDYRAVAQAHLQAGWIPPNTRVEEFESAIRTVCEPIFAKPISEISFGKLMMQLFQTARRFEMPVQPQLVLLYKTLLNIEGLGRQLYPDLNLWDTAKPFLENWMKQQLGPKQLLKELKQDWPKWRAILPELPNYLTQTIDNAQQQQVLTKQHLAALSTLQQEQQQNRLASFHQLFGLSLTISSLSIYLLAENAYLQENTLTQISPILGVLGVAWAYLKSKPK